MTDIVDSRRQSEMMARIRGRDTASHMSWAFAFGCIGKASPAGGGCHTNGRGLCSVRHREGNGHLTNSATVC